MPATSSDATKPVEAYRSAQFLAQLEFEINMRREELDALIRARDVLQGTPRGHLISNHTAGDTAPTTLSNAVEQILTGRPDGLHITALLKELQTRFGMSPTPKNLVNTLNRWVGRRQRFVRPRANTFAVKSGTAGATGRRAAAS